MDSYRFPLLEAKIPYDIKKNVMMEYIVPQITKYSNIDELLKNESKTPSLSDRDNFLSIDDLLSENFVCIVGEPGVGKSRLISEVKTKLTEKSFSFCKNSIFFLSSNIWNSFSFLLYSLFLLSTCSFSMR